MELPRFRIGLEATQRDWEFFLHKWRRYKRLCLSGSPAQRVQDLLWSCCSEQLEEVVFDSGATQDTPEGELLDVMERLAVNREEAAVPDEIPLEPVDPAAGENVVSPDSPEDGTRSPDSPDMQILMNEEVQGEVLVVQDIQNTMNEVEEVDIPVEAEVQVEFKAEPVKDPTSGKWRCSQKCRSSHNLDHWSQKQNVIKHIALKHPDPRINYFECKLCQHTIRGYKQPSCYATLEHIRTKHIDQVPNGSSVEAQCENILALFNSKLCRVQKKAEEKWFIYTDVDICNQTEPNLHHEQSRCINGALSQEGTNSKMKRKMNMDPNQERTVKKANPPLDDRMAEAAVSNNLEVEAANTLSTMASLEAARSPMPSAANRSADFFCLFSIIVFLRTLETPVNSPSEPASTVDLGGLGDNPSLSVDHF